MATRTSSIPGPSGYVLVPLRESADFTLYRGRKHDDREFLPPPRHMANHEANGIELRHCPAYIR